MAVIFRSPDENDQERIEALQAEQIAKCSSMGVKQAALDLRRWPTLRVRVGERDGRIVGLHYLVATAELVTCSEDVEFFKALPRELDGVVAWLKHNGFQMGRGFVPRPQNKNDINLPRLMGRYLRPFPMIRKSENLEHFFIDLTEAPERKENNHVTR